MRKALWIVAAAVLGTGGVARAQGMGTGPVMGVNQHDGFFLQMDLGIGAMKSAASEGGVDLDFSGGAGAFSIAIGGAVTPNFIVAGHLWGASVNEPEVKLNGQSLGSATDATLTLSAIGVNLTYYFMPYNFYVQATPSLGVLTAEQGGSSGDTKSGFALRLAVGKEWWVSDNWGLGLNLQFAHASNQIDAPNGATYGTNWFGVAFSATYN